MAVSPLAQIDWDNLEGEDSNTVILLLQKAFNERMVVAFQQSGTYYNDLEPANFFPFPDGAHTNNPDWGLSGTPSLWRFGKVTVDIGGGGRLAIQDLVRFYADMTYINANINTVVTEIEGAFSEDGITLTATKVFNHIGITDWPTVINPNAVELKQWYDILKLLTHVYCVGSGGNTGSSSIGGVDRREWSGLFTEDGSGRPSDTDYSDTIGGLPPLSQISTDWAQLYAGPEAKASLTSDDRPGDDFDLVFDGRFDPYEIRSTKEYLYTDNQRLTDTGYTRVPSDFVCYGQYSIGSNAAAATWISTNSLTDLKLVEFSATQTRTAAEKEQVVTVAPFTEPPAFADDAQCSITWIRRFFEVWNDPTGTDGFEFYTP